MMQHVYPTPTTAPAKTYHARLEDCQKQAATLQKRHLWLSYLRLLWVVAALSLAWIVFGRHGLHWTLLLLPVAAFGVTASFHDRTLEAADRSRRAVAWYQHGLARIEDRWAGLRPVPVPPGAASSLFAADLDLFGPSSVFELLCTARSSLGEATLADWLLHPAARDEVIARQGAVQELGANLSLREQMASAKGPATVPLNTEMLNAWGSARTANVPFVFRWLAPVLALLTVAAGVRWFLGHSPLLLSAALLLNERSPSSCNAAFNLC